VEAVELLHILLSQRVKCVHSQNPKTELLHSQQTNHWKHLTKDCYYSLDYIPLLFISTEEVLHVGILAGNASGLEFVVGSDSEWGFQLPEGVIDFTGNIL